MNMRLIRCCQSLLFIVAAVATSACSLYQARPSQADFGRSWQAVSCKTFDVADTIAAESDCGYVTVPAQRAYPQGPTIQLAVVRVRSSSNTPEADPLFVEQGGPGDTTIGVFVNFALPMKSPGLINILKGRDLIFVEERGTRYSKPFLSCPEINAHNVAVAKGEKAATDPGWIKACNERFKAAGINPSAFNTRENAADIYFVAETLGYQQFNFYGGSYGTLLGQYVSAQSGKHKAKLRSAILDGVVRPDIDFNLGFSHTISHALRNVFNDCAQDLRCSQTYPGLEQKFLKVVDQLNLKPVDVTLTVPSTKQTFAAKLNGNGFVDGILSTLYRTTEAHGLPKLIKAASRGDFSWITEPLSGDLEPGNAKEMYHTVLCARTKSIGVTPSEVLPPPYPQMLALAKREADVVRNACDVLKVELKPPFVYENPDIPVLVLNGAYDPATPQPYGEAVAKNFTTSYVYTFPAVGHISLILKPGIPAASCSSQIAVAFLNKPNQTPDSSCLSQIKPAFVLE
ncbi:MAG: alpha/beta fold hydrolase [Comamonadaceae bacterium]|nr:alpha/beta fold hydrolase [Comamonadaceae bacterium]